MTDDRWQTTYDRWWMSDDGCQTLHFSATVAYFVWVLIMWICGFYGSEQGGGANYLCLPEQPQYSNYTPGVQSGWAYLMEQSIGLEDLTQWTMVHLCMQTTMSHVQRVTLQLKELLWWFLHDLPTHHPGPEYASCQSVLMFECMDHSPQSVPGSIASMQMKLYSTTLKWSVAMEFHVHHMLHRKKSCVLSCLYHIVTLWTPSIVVITVTWECASLQL